MVACLPYALAAVFVDFVHVDPPGNGRVPLNGPSAMVEAAPSTPPPAGDGDSSCPACVWLRVTHRTGAHVSIDLARRAAIAEIVVLDCEWPDNPIPRDAALRGPPRPTFS
jgi:hypothetical protein